jgi:hypothetical protein
MFMSLNSSNFQARTDVTTQVTPSATEVLDAVQQQRWVLAPVEALVWQHLLAHPSDGISEVVRGVVHQEPGCTPAQVWAAFDALADRNLLLNRPVPPTAETVSHHLGLNRRQWAVAGLALAASPMAFAATAAATEETAKQKQSQRQGEALKKQRMPQQEEDEKRQSPASEQGQKQQMRKQEQAQKYDSRAQEHQVKQNKQKASVNQPADEASKPF